MACVALRLRQLCTSRSYVRLIKLELDVQGIFGMDLRQLCVSKSPARLIKPDLHVQGMFGSGAWSGDERLELRHRSLLIPAEPAGPEARWDLSTEACSFMPGISNCSAWASC